MRSDVYLEPEQIPLAYAAAAGKLSAALLPRRRSPGNRTLAEEFSACGQTGARSARRWWWMRRERGYGRWPRWAARLKAGADAAPADDYRPLPGCDRSILLRASSTPTSMCGRARVGLMLGRIRGRSCAVCMGTMPKDFSIDQLALDLGVLRRLAEGVAVQLPVFKDVALQEYRGGLPTMTADEST